MDDAYITEEELAAMSEDELADWMSAYMELADKIMSDKDEAIRGMTLKDLQSAYDTPEFQGFLDEMEKADFTDYLFDDEKELEKIRELWNVAKTLPDDDSDEARDAAFMPLYAAFYPFLRRVNPFWGVGAERLSVWSVMQELCRTVYTITIRTAEPFRDLVDPDIYESIGDRDVFTLGAVRRAGIEDVAAGILIYSIHAPEDDDDEPVVKLEWLYVAEEFRGMHVGDDLMASMYHTVSQAGIHAVTADVPAEGLLPVSVCDFLSSWHILFSLEPMEYHIAPLEELRKDAVFPAGISTEGIYENYEAGKYIVFSYEGRDAELVIDIKPSGTLAVSGISADNEKETCALLSRALDRCCELFEPDTMVYMEPESEEDAALVDRLIPGHGVRLHLVGANVTEHADITGEVFEDMRVVYRQQASA